jgi:hypothetical protein
VWGTVHKVEIRNAYKILTGKPDWKRLLRRSGHSWKDNIKMDIREIGLENVDWVHPAQDTDRQAVVNIAMNLQIS